MLIYYYVLFIICLYAGRFYQVNYAIVNKIILDIITLLILNLYNTLN
jgi:hypothetical protein